MWWSDKNQSISTGGISKETEENILQSEDRKKYLKFKHLQLATQDKK